jgi:hypothetical protein
MGLETKTYWLTDRQSQCDFDLITRESWDGCYKSRRLVWDGRQSARTLSPRTEERPLLEDVTK